MPAQTVVFHLQGQHDQQSHAGGRGASGGRVAGYIDVHDTDMVRDAFDADFTTVNGRKVHSLIDEIRTDDPKMTDVRGTLYAEDPIGDEMYRVGQFRRMLYADGEVYNDSLYVWPSHSNEGIGTAFLDYSERQLANAGFDTILVDAVEIGQYAWAARGYKLQDFEVRMGTHRDWLELAAVQNDELGGKFTTEIDALARSWDAPGADVYGADLIALDPAFSSVFLEGPSWSGTRSIASLRDPLVASTAGLEVFHLDGQHDQQSHAGGRGASYGGDRTGYPEVDAVIEDFLDEPQGDWTTSDTKIGDMEAVDCAGACDSVAEQFTEYATERGLKVYTTRTSVDEMGYEITGDPAGEVMDADGNIVDGFYQDHTVNQVYVDGQGWPLTIDFTARQYGYDTPVKTDPAVREDDGLAVEVFHLQGQHDQKAHGRRGAGSPIEDLVGGSDGRSPKHQGYFGEITFGRYHGTEDTGVYSVTVQEHGDSSSWENDQYDVEITTDEDGNMTAAEVTRRVTRNDIGNPEMAADDLNSLFEEHGVILGWGDAVVDGHRVQTVDEAAEIAREEALEEARGVAYETLWSAYNFDVTDRNGESFLVESDPTVDNPGFGVVQGRIRSYAWTDRGSYDGETIGTFEREVDLAFGRVDNSSFKIEPAWQGRGIGTAFLDRSEAALADAGIERSRLTAVDVGRYAWMARGYQVSLTDRASVVSKWVPEIESILETREFTDVQRSQARAVTRSWQAGDDVYGADLLSVSDEFADVFLNGPTYTASRELVPSPRARAWVDPNQTELDLSVEVFHLQGQHNQKDHGRRGGARSGIDALEASDIPVMTDEYGELLITSTGVDRIRQIAYDYDGGSDVYDVVIVENDDGTIAVDVENLYGMDGTIEGEQALERYLNDNGIDDVRWDGERGTLHASHRAAVMAGDATAAQKLLVNVEEAYSGSFEVNGETYVIGETSTYMREAPPILGEDNASVEIRGSIMQGDVTGKEVGTFSRAVYEDGTVYNHSLSIDRDLQGQGIGTAFLEMTEGALQPEVIKMAAVNVGKYAWAARGYRLDTSSNSTLAATTRDSWASGARDMIAGFSPMMMGPMEPEVAERAEAVLRSWSDDLNNVVPADLLAVDGRFRNVFLEGPSWDAVKRRDDDRALTAAAGLEVFHLQGQHDQQTHAGGRGKADGWEDRRKYSQGTENETRAAKVFSGQFEVDGYSYGVETVTTRDEYGDVKLEGRIFDTTREPRWEGDQLGDEVGKFMRTVHKSGRVTNDVFIMNDDYKGKGIGTGFLDYTEQRLQAEFGTTEIELKAVETGRYAWAARGYGTYDSGAVEQWQDAARAAVRNGALGTDNANYRAFESVMQDWDARVDAIEAVYPGDLLTITPRFKRIFLEDDSPDWNAVRFLVPLTAAAGVEQFHYQGQHDQQNHAGGRAARPDGVGYLESWRFGTDEFGRPGIERRVYAYTGWDDEYGEPDTNSPVEERWGVDGRGEGDGVLDYAPPPSADVASNLTDDEAAAIRAELAAADPSVLDGIEMSASGLPRAGLSVPDRLILNELDAHLTAPVPSDLADKYRGLLAGGDVRAVADAAFDDFAITPESGLIYTVGSEWNASALSKLGVSVGLTVDPDAYGYMRSASGAIGNQRQGDPPVDYARAKEISAALPTSLSLATTAVNRHTQDVISEMYPSGQVPVYRGVTRPAVEGAVSINPVSSWSLEAQWAANFGERSVKATVPVSSVFSYGAATGWGAQSEAEVILSTPSQTVTIDEVRTEDRWETFASEGKLNIDEGEEDWIKQAARPAAGVETFHLQGQHDQQSHAGGRGGEAPTPPTVEEFEEAYDTVDPIPVYERMGIDQTIMRAADFSEGEHDASWAHAAYTLGGSEAMNKYLRGQELPVHFQDDHATDAEILKQAIAEAEPTKHDLVVYRGLGRFPRGMEGERIQDNGFISTSLDRRVAESFGNVVEIRVPAGTRAIAGNWGEFEVILAPGTQFDVTEDGLDVV